MMLAIEDEAGTRSIVPFTTDAIVVGRGTEGVTFRLADRNVSRRHARFLRQNGAVFVEDLGSLTGTRVNGEKITARRRLRDGDLVQIGDYDLAVLEEGEALVPDPPPPLPAAPRAETATTTQKLPAYVEPVPAAVAPPPPAPSPAAPAQAPAPRSRTLGVAMVVALVCLVVGLVAGWATGTLTTAP